ncbi:hypothetical protein TWF730_006537 [Orbilia blumenaviensis]|uniref:F-box domain-containing protein n=1 Tax=Orbilia blumenaviensis TaxID=1796055 RepID=A0AAV9VEL3_9PEZI
MTSHIGTPIPTGVTSLPVEIQLKILSYLPWESRYYCSRASRRWRDILLAYGQDVIFNNTSFEKLRRGRVISAGTSRTEYPHYGVHCLFGERITLDLGSDDKIATVSFTSAGKTQCVSNLESCYLMNDLMFEPTDSIPDVRRLLLSIMIEDQRIAMSPYGFTGTAQVSDMTVMEFVRFVVEMVLQQPSIKELESRKRITLENPTQALYFVGIATRLTGVNDN